MLFESVSSSNVRVRINYFQVQACWGGPFVWVRNNAERIAPVINPEELIDLMSVPLNFNERRCMFACMAIFLSLITAATIAFLVYINQHPNGPESATSMFIFLLTIPGLVILQSLCVWFCVRRFNLRLLTYISDLNEIACNTHGVEFYYDDIANCGKSTSILGIRKADFTNASRSVEGCS